MPGTEEHQDWVSCLQLLVMPWRLPRYVFVISPVTACLLGTLSVWWILGSFMALLGVSFSESWGWSGIWYDLKAVVGVCAMASGIIAFVCGIAFWPMREISNHEHHPLTFALSFVCMLPVYTIWLVSNAIIEFSYRMQNPGNVLDVLADMVIVQIVSSCFWLPLIIIVWIVLVIFSIRTADKIFLLRYEYVCICGYDLRGSIAGGSKKCPECGIDIPGWMLTKSLLMRVDS